MKYLFVHEISLINQSDSYTPDDVSYVNEGHLDIIRFNPDLCCFERILEDKDYDAVEWEKIEELDQPTD